MSVYVNQWKEIGSDRVVQQFACACPPDSNAHERMLAGALRNANLERFWLDDGKSAEQAQAV